jgi:hypothetical protein
MERGQPSCMVRLEWLTQMHHFLSSDAYILDAAPPAATGVKPISLWLPTLTQGIILCRPFERLKEKIIFDMGECFYLYFLMHENCFKLYLLYDVSIY